MALSHVDYHKESKHNGLNDVSLVVHRGEIVGIAGVDGNGQTQLTQIITGVIAPDSGTLELSGALAGLMTESGKLGFIGGFELDTTKGKIAGFEEAAK